ncbi:hypothetical protein PAXRUDRAFT_528904 [Paxillus rubicundulus Ve08.2h10]|uniref:Uncharacterized protein n=1 Tax=Paxillus rubicundulus Ve08.2h10 TaxID=930991 RepID=A0A0D0E677_9AGAM|nr:hypothetical protein PAXRUDRAFT_528904 [Paxillus rubicundulus Ve08.2h10]
MVHEGRSPFVATRIHRSRIHITFLTAELQVKGNHSENAGGFASRSKSSQKGHIRGVSGWAGERELQMQFQIVNKAQPKKRGVQLREAEQETCGMTSDTKPTHLSGCFTDRKDRAKRLEARS